ncbi:MAG: bifunctional aldolase/short-chain dehydrogenase [Microbacteriaceae bacterium]
MQNRWNDTDAAALTNVLEECAYGSRLLGSEPSLVLHGGGNTSVKGSMPDPAGGEFDVLWVKGSGWDLATIEPAGFAPLRLDRLREILKAPSLSDPEMVNELRCALRAASAPNPSVESLLHAYLPFTAVQHSHADVIVTLTNQPNGHDAVREVFGDDVLILPYAMPGFDLAQLVVKTWEENYREGMVGMVLLNHGLFTFGATTKEAYERHIALITRAEQYLTEKAPLSAPTADALAPADPLELAALRTELSSAAGFPVIVQQHRDARVAEFVARTDLGDVTQRGTATPDHTIFTKRTPMVGTDVAGYVSDYAAYFERNRDRAAQALDMLDPAPRVVLDPTLGMLSVGRTVKAACVVEDIFRHTMDVQERAELIGSFQTPSEGELFDVEYWDLEQAKLRAAGAPPVLAGYAAVVTGAASGIGRACAEALLAAGANVIGWDLSAGVATTFSSPNWLGLQVDVTDESSREDAIRRGIEHLGGIDIVVIAAGIFPASARISELASSDWRRTQSVNVDSVVGLFGQVHPYLALSPAGGKVVVIGSKNVAAPGPGAAAYSASKAALNQLSRIAALEWAEDGIRVNIIHPDAVFDTALWTPELLAARAERYGVTVEEYKKRNLLGTEVTSAAVARMATAMVTDLFACTTGAQVPVDGGNDRVI